MRKLIFMVSAQRSGSTWLGNVFNSHPDVVYRHEPLARLSPFINAQTLHHLKTNFQLSPFEHEELLELLLRFYPESWRPPFFKKSYLKLDPQFQYFAWIMATKWQVFKRLYLANMSIKKTDNLTLLIKETGWSIQVESIIKGLAPDHIIFLIRHPCAVISSILDGKKQSKEYHADSNKAKWFYAHKDCQYIVSQEIKLEDILQYDPVVYWSTRIRVLYDIFIDLHSKNINSSFFINYEEFQQNPIEEATKIFQHVGLNFAENVSSFLLESINSKFKVFSLDRDAKNEYYSIKRNKHFDPYKWQRKLSKEQIKSIKIIMGNNILNRFWPI